MVERLLRQIVSSGVAAVTVITGWRGERVQAHLQSLTDLPAGATISFVQEERPMGTVGALSLVDAPEDQVLFAFADLVTELDFGELLDRHERSRADLTLASHVETHRLSLGEIQSVGNTVVGYLEKPAKQFTICSGIAVIEQHVAKLAGGTADTYGLPDLVVDAIASNACVKHWLHGAFWRDVNSPEALLEVEQHYGGEELRGSAQLDELLLPTAAEVQQTVVRDMHAV
jgi:NDP-sugar pyrophosphorylase family protein